MGMIPQGYVVNHYLTDTDAFFIKTDVPNGMKHFDRSPIKTSMEGDFDTGNVRYKARERYVFGFSDHRGIFGSRSIINKILVAGHSSATFINIKVRNEKILSKYLGLRSSRKI